MNFFRIKKSLIIRKKLHLYNRTYVCYYDVTLINVEGVKVMENQVHDGIYHDNQVNIPIQLLSITDRDGKITPLWFRVETEEHEIKKFRIEDIISRSDKNFVGIKEKQFVCRIEQDGMSKTLEMRYNTATQKWRIFQFL